jgi:hypothetical protein
MCFYNIAVAKKKKEQKTVVCLMVMMPIFLYFVSDSKIDRLLLLWTLHFRWSGFELVDENPGT